MSLSPEQNRRLVDLASDPMAMDALRALAEDTIDSAIHGICPPMALDEYGYVLGARGWIDRFLASIEGAYLNSEADYLDGGSATELPQPPGRQGRK